MDAARCGAGVFRRALKIDSEIRDVVEYLSELVLGTDVRSRYFVFNKYGRVRVAENRRTLELKLFRLVVLRSARGVRSVASIA